MSDLFIQERQGTPPTPNPFRPYAERYHDICNRFDATRNHERQGGEINRHAVQLREQLAREAFIAGLADSVDSAENLLRVAINGVYHQIPNVKKV